MAVDRLANVISCHAWSQDCATLALCPNSHEIHLYEATGEGKGLNRTVVLEEHSQLVSSLDWGSCNQFVSCSHDSTAFVWSRAEGLWTPELVQYVSKHACCVMHTQSSSSHVCNTAALASCYIVHLISIWAASCRLYNRPESCSLKFTEGQDTQPLHPVHAGVHSAEQGCAERALEPLRTQVCDRQRRKEDLHLLPRARQRLVGRQGAAALPRQQRGGCCVAPWQPPGGVHLLRRALQDLQCGDSRHLARLLLSCLLCSYSVTVLAGRVGLAQGLGLGIVMG